MSRLVTVGFAAVTLVAAIAAFVLQSQQNAVGFLAATLIACWAASIAALAHDRRNGVIVVTALAFCVAMYLGSHHVDLSAQAICNVNEVFNCDRVNRSEWSEIRGVPIAWIGAAFYAGTLLVTLLARPGSSGFKNAPHMVLLGGAGAVGYSLFLAWASTQIGAWCLFCIDLYGLNLLLLVAGALWVRDSGIPAGEGIKAVLFARQEKSLTVLGLVVFAGLIAGRVYNKPTSTTTAVPGSSDTRSAPEFTVYIGPSTVLTDGTEPVLGNPNGRITVVEFADFECPFCGQVAPDVHDLASASPDLRILFKNYPLDQACNPNIKRVFHKDSCRAAEAGECARQQGRFWELNRLMFMNQEDLDDDALRFMAGQVGLDMATFESCWNAPETVTAVQEDISSASAIGVDGTPSIYVRGLYGDAWVQVRRPSDIGVLLKMVADGETLPTPIPRPSDQ